MRSGAMPENSAQPPSEPAPGAQGRAPDAAAIKELHMLSNQALEETTA
jgi:hypothetical protein